MRWRLPVLVAVLLLAACSDQRSGVSAEDLRRRMFALTEVHGVDLVVDDFTVSFHLADLGWGGICNSIGGTYEIEGRVLRFTTGGGTEAGCDDERMRQDEWLADFLESGPTIELEGDDLTLGSDDVTLVFTDTGCRTGESQDCQPSRPG